MIGLDGGDAVNTKTVILASGVDWCRLVADGVDRFIGRGVLFGAARTGANCRRKASLYHWRRQLCRRGCPVLRKLCKFSDNAGPRSRSEAPHVAILDRSDHASAAHSYGDGNSGSLCRRHGLLKGYRNPESGGPVVRRPADALFVMIGANVATHWLPAQAPTRKRLCPQGTRGKRPAKLGGRSQLRSCWKQIFRASSV